MSRTLLLLVALAGVASATYDRNCNGFYPIRPILPPKFSPSPRSVCDFDIDCPRAPNQCFETSKCVNGYCSAPTPKSFGTYCDDGNAYTDKDICSGTGVCAGLGEFCFFLFLFAYSDW